MLYMRRRLPLLVMAGMLLCPGPSARATWSVVVCDTETKEIAVGVVTCLVNFDLRNTVPVIIVGKGGAAVQAFGDSDGRRRKIIFDGLIAGTAPADMLLQLAAVTGHDFRQYGIVDTLGRSLTFTGDQTSAWAGGVLGSQGTLVYAIQGNILAGDCVVPACEAALRDTPGDLPEKLMAAMQAARMAGGDGRCSCATYTPTACGCPPPSYTKCGHCGVMLVARIGDEDDVQCTSLGCADGVYYMRLNVANQPATAADPVEQLQSLFDTFRATRLGRADAIHSLTAVAPPVVAPNGHDGATLTITLRDWADNPITDTIAAVTVTHAPESAGISQIGAVTDQGGGVYQVALTAGTEVGVDRLRIVVDRGTPRPISLMPDPKVRYYKLGDLNCDGAVTFADIDAFVLALSDPTQHAQVFPDCTARGADCNADGFVNLGDVDAFVARLGQ